MQNRWCTCLLYPVCCDMGAVWLGRGALSFINISRVSWAYQTSVSCPLASSVWTADLETHLIRASPAGIQASHARIPHLLPKSSSGSTSCPFEAIHRPYFPNWIQRSADNSRSHHWCLPWVCERHTAGRIKRVLQDLNRWVNNELISACNSHGLVEGECLSLDNTFKSAAKATVVDKSKGRTKLLKGGVLSVLNEKNEIISWVSNAQASSFGLLLKWYYGKRFCQTQSTIEITEVFNGLKKCYTILGI